MPSGPPDAAPNGKENQMVRQRPAGPDDHYQWVALANTTAAMFMATLDSITLGTSI